MLYLQHTKVTQGSTGLYQAQLPGLYPASCLNAIIVLYKARNKSTINVGLMFSTLQEYDRACPNQIAVNKKVKYKY